jgi:hypothetical protein
MVRQYMATGGSLDNWQSHQTKKARKAGPFLFGGQGRNRTTDTRIFSIRVN